MNSSLRFSSQTCLIYGHCVQGFGDISCAMKVAKKLNKEMEFPISHIFVATNEPEKARIFDSKNKFTILTYEEALQKKDLSFQIIVPTSTGYVLWALATSIPTLCIAEYGFNCERTQFENYPWISCEAFGINKEKDQIGILIDSKLSKIGFDPKFLLSINRLKFLEGLSSSLKETILKNQSIAEFDRESLLYLGYGKKEKARLSFLSAIALLNQDKTKNLSFVLPGAPIHEQAHLEYLRELAKRYQFNTCFITFSQKELKFENFFENPNFTKSLHLIFGIFSHSDLKKILLASEKEMLVTGDQSLSEAIANNKNWFYEELEHKLDLADDLYKIIRESSYEEVWKNNIQPASPFRSIYEKLLFESFKKRAENNYKICSLINEELVDKHNCFDNFRNSVLKVLSQNPYSIISLDSRDQLAIDDFPIGEIVRVNGDQIRSLKINLNGEAEAGGFRGIKFQTKFFGNYPSDENTSIYLAKRLS